MMCKALESITNGDNPDVLRKLNKNSANCEIRIPLQFDKLLSSVKACSDVICIWVKWSDTNHLYVVPNMSHQFIQNPYSGAMPSSSQQPANNTELIMHKLHMLVVNRVFIQRKDITFDRAYCVPIHKMRQAVNVLHNMGHELLNLVDYGDVLHVVGVKSQCKSAYGIPLCQSVANGPSKRKDDNDESPPYFGIAFPIEPINLFLKHKCASLKRVAVMFNETSVCMETIFETCSFMNPQIVSGQLNSESSTGSNEHGDILIGGSAKKRKRATNRSTSKSANASIHLTKQFKTQSSARIVILVNQVESFDPHIMYNVCETVGIPTKYATHRTKGHKKQSHDHESGEHSCLLLMMMITRMRLENVKR